MPRPPVERDIRKQDMVFLARQLFVSDGIESTTMENIARAAGVTRRTMYAYFKSRDEICLMVMADDVRSRWAMQREAIERGANGLEKILIWGQSLWEFSKARPHSMELQVWWDFHGIDRQLISDDVFDGFEKLNDDLADGLRQVFQLGIDDGTLRPDLPVDLTIGHFLQTVRAVIHRALSPHYSFASFDPDEYVERYLDLFIRAIRHQGGNKS